MIFQLHSCSIGPRITYLKIANIQFLFIKDIFSTANLVMFDGFCLTALCITVTHQDMQTCRMLTSLQISTKFLIENLRAKNIFSFKADMNISAKICFRLHQRFWSQIAFVNAAKANFLSNLIISALFEWLWKGNNYDTCGSLQWFCSVSVKTKEPIILLMMNFLRG